MNEWIKNVKKNSRPIKDFKVGDVITVNDKMQKYTYKLEAKMGDIEFKASYTPAEMLKMGVFEGHYMTDCYQEFPREWYLDALDRMDPTRANPELNMFKIKSRQSLQEWQRRGWIPIILDDPDVRGWFQWYCRYWMGRRVPALDAVQIARWKKINRHLAQVQKHCTHGATCTRPMECRPKQRMTLLQWSYPALAGSK